MTASSSGAGHVRSPVASRSHCATAPSTLTTRRPPALVSRDSAALMSATRRLLNVSINAARSATERVQRSSFAISTAATGRPFTSSMTRCHPGRSRDLADAPASTTTSNQAEVVDGGERLEIGALLGAGALLTTEAMIAVAPTGASVHMLPDVAPHVAPTFEPEPSSLTALTVAHRLWLVHPEPRPRHPLAPMPCIDQGRAR